MSIGRAVVIFIGVLFFVLGGYGAWTMLNEPCPSRAHLTCEEEMQDIRIPTAITIMGAVAGVVIALLVATRESNNVPLPPRYQPPPQHQNAERYFQDADNVELEDWP